MGLLMGSTLLTVFEVLDFVLFNYFRKRAAKKCKRQSERDRQKQKEELVGTAAKAKRDMAELEYISMEEDIGGLLKPCEHGKDQTL